MKKEMNTLNNEKQVIKLDGICKQYGNRNVLTDVTFEAKPGRVTAFLGPNGAGKSSTLRILLGLDAPLSGTATFGGKKYTHLETPLQVVGTVFDNLGGAHYRKVQTHLRMIAKSNNIPDSRVSDVLSLVNLTDKSKAKLETLSLGEGQRLGIAVALLGDPQYLVFDEPVNGLDPGGIRWFRQFIQEQAGRGKTVLLSSHFLSEVESIADDIKTGEIFA